MKKTISVPVTEELLAYCTDIPYKVYHYGWGMDSLCLSCLFHKDKKKYPALIWICGGAFDTENKDYWIPEMQFFAKHGYVVFGIDYRTNNIAPYPALLEDAKAAVRFIRAHADEFGVDPERIAIMGESAGAYLASMVGVTGNERKYDVGENLDQSSAVQAVVNIYGRTQQVQGYREKVEQKRVRNTTMLLLDGTPEDIPEVYEEANPSNHLDPETPPFLLLHGTDDELVPHSHNDIFYEDLQKAGVESDYYLLEGGQHGSAHFYQQPVKEIMLEFFNRYLQD